MNLIKRMDPYAELRRMSEFFDNALLASSADRPASTLMPLDVVEEATEFVIRASVPGIKPEELSVTAEEGVLTIRGEHQEQTVSEDAKVYRRELRYGSFTRSIRLPDNVDMGRAVAAHADGIVTIRLPKMSEPKPSAITIPVSRPIEGQNPN